MEILVLAQAMGVRQIVVAITKVDMLKKGQFCLGVVLKRRKYHREHIFARFSNIT